MVSTRSSTQADPRFDGGGGPMAAEDPFTEMEQALARHVHASYPPGARSRGPASDRPADKPRWEDGLASLAYDCWEDGVASLAYDAADLRPPIRRGQRPPATRGILARDAIVVCLGALVIWGAAPTPDSGPAAAPPATAMSVPASQAESIAASIAEGATTNDPDAASAGRAQGETSNLAALRQAVAQLTAGQEELTREIANLQAEKLQAEKLQAEKPQAEKPQAEKVQADKPLAAKPDRRGPTRVSTRAPNRVSAPSVPRVATSMRKSTPLPVPTPPQAARRVAAVSAPSPAPQIPPQTQPSNVLRPPMPVP